MTIKIEKIISKCSQLHQSNMATIRRVAEVSDLLVSAFPAVWYLQLFYRSVEAYKSKRLRWSCTHQWTSSRRFVIRKYNDKTLWAPAFSHSIESDASSLGWGAWYNTNTKPAWTLVHWWSQTPYQLLGVISCLRRTPVFCFPFTLEYVCWQTIPRLLFT